ncbi:MAG: hypothetical protein AB7T38_14055 [Nitrospirales bacterium]
MPKLFKEFFEAVDWYGRWTTIKEIWLLLSSPTGGAIALPIISLDWPIWGKVLVVLYGLTFLPILALFVSYIRTGPLRLVPYDGEIIQSEPIDDDSNVIPLKQGDRQAVSLTP